MGKWYSQPAEMQIQSRITDIRKRRAVISRERDGKEFTLHDLPKNKPEPKKKNKRTKSKPTTENQETVLVEEAEDLTEVFAHKRRRDDREGSPRLMIKGCASPSHE
ncbi:hypothetical protein AXF42_Ash010084 [Apostasia shenzhenica]|uniref:Uncharacterized protein n=1 Tax=Apostasia shenzhenica TaxID=1088818 RepID=A0A2I0ACT2_9ASPA|nr:hypothetical protein AXF42_Ash010084 [Apostasia shenzhenica]